MIGGGPIGIEMAQAHRRLGSAVTVIEAGPSILPKDDPDHVEIVREALRDEELSFLKTTGRRRLACVMIAQSPLHWTATGKQLSLGLIFLSRRVGARIFSA